MDKIVKREKTVSGNKKKVTTTINSPFKSGKTIQYSKDTEKGTRSGNVVFKQKTVTNNGTNVSYKDKLKYSGKDKYGNKVKKDLSGTKIKYNNNGSKQVKTWSK